MHVAIGTMEWVNNLMAEIMMSNYRKQGFDLMNIGGQDGAFNEPCE